MSSRNSRFTHGLAGPEDREQLLALYEAMEFGGPLSILYARRPDPLASLAREGDSVIFPVVREGAEGPIVGGGCCVIREAWLGGALRRVGYLTGLKILPAYRRRIPGIGAMYRYLYEQCRGQVDYFYTTILTDNTEARRLLEKRRPQMPAYRYEGDYTVYSFKTGGRPNPAVKAVGPEAWEAFAREHGPRFNLSLVREPAADPGALTRWLLTDAGGKALAGCLLWNQQAFKQHIPVAYGGPYRLLRHLPLGWAGYPSLPPLGEPMNFSCVTALYAAGDDPAAAAVLLKGVAAEARAYRFLALGLHGEHPLTPALTGIRSIRYQSRLYSVAWEQEALVPDDRPFQLEVALL